MLSGRCEGRGGGLDTGICSPGIVKSFKLQVKKRNKMCEVMSQLKTEVRDAKGKRSMRKQMRKQTARPFFGSVLFSALCTVGILPNPWKPASLQFKSLKTSRPDDVD